MISLMIRTSTHWRREELSMLAWAVAKIHGRGRTSVRASRANTAAGELVNILLRVVAASDVSNSNWP
eukprot:2606054-Amphidinium_carterae.1